jgi:hypothetical protein
MDVVPPSNDDLDLARRIAVVDYERISAFFGMFLSDRIVRTRSPLPDEILADDIESHWQGRRAGKPRMVAPQFEFVSLLGGNVRLFSSPRRRAVELRRLARQACLAGIPHGPYDRRERSAMVVAATFISLSAIFHLSFKSPLFDTDSVDCAAFAGDSLIQRLTAGIARARPVPSFSQVRQAALRRSLANASLTLREVAATLLLYFDKALPPV